MIRLLRGVLDYGDQKLTAEARAVNYQRLRSSKIEWDRPDDERVAKFVDSFFQAQLDLPSSQTVQDYFEQLQDLEVLERLKVIGSSAAVSGANYSYLLDDVIERKNRTRVASLLKETEEIVTKGMSVQEGREKVRLQGVKDGLLFFNRRVLDLIPSEHNAQTRGNLRNDTKMAWRDYQTAKVDKSKAYGKATGFSVIDTVCHGCKRGELWIHAGSQGDLKTTFSLNWAYNLVTRYRSNVYYISLEMPYQQVRNNICAMHSSNAKFQVQGKKSLDYRKIRDGELSPEEEAFYQEVLEDFHTNPEYCQFRLWCPDRDVTIEDIRLQAELVHKELEVGLIVVDHSGLVEPRKQHKDYTIAFNSVIRDAKKMALHFNGGEGVAVLLLHQLSRQGRLEAEKNKGVYRLSALSYANEAERSADYVTTTFLDGQLRDEGRTVLANQKNRDNPSFKPSYLSIDFGCRRMFNCDPVEDDMGVDEHSSVLSAAGTGVF